MHLTRWEAWVLEPSQPTSLRAEKARDVGVAPGPKTQPLGPSLSTTQPKLATTLSTGSAVLGADKPSLKLTPGEKPDNRAGP